MDLTDERMGGRKRERKGGEAVERRGSLGGHARTEIRDARTDGERKANSNTDRRMVK